MEKLSSFIAGAIFSVIGLFLGLGIGTTLQYMGISLPSAVAWGFFYGCGLLVAFGAKSLLLKAVNGKFFWLGAIVGLTATTIFMICLMRFLFPIIL
jgi:hypothetical protein